MLTCRKNETMLSKTICWRGLWVSPCWSDMLKFTIENWKRIMLIYSMLKLQRGPWRKRKDVCKGARVLWCLLLFCTLTGVRWNCFVWMLMFSMVGCWSQPQWDASKTSLLQRTWWRCPRGLPACWSWRFSRRRWAPIVGWRGASARYALPSLMIQSLLLYSFHSRNPCRSWCWPSSCWALPSKSCGCVVLLLLLCWLRRVLLQRCWVLLLIVCGFRNALLLPCT